MVQVSGGALARTSSVAPSIKIKSNFRGNRVDTIFRAGLLALLFFSFRAGLLALLFFRDAFLMANTNPIQQSLEPAAERCEDLTPLVYRRLFREHPEAEAMFRHEENDSRVQCRP